MEKPLPIKVSGYLLLFTFLSLCWSASFAQQKNLKTRSDNPKAIQHITGHNNLRKLSKIYDQQTRRAAHTQEKPRWVGDDAQLRRMYELEILKDPATGKIPAHIRERELAFAKKFQTKASRHAQGRVVEDWSPRGPYNVGGRTRALALDLDDEDNILAGGVSGGMWRSEDAGLTWYRTTGSNEVKSVTALVQDPRPGYRNVWYYSSGERIGNSASEVGAFFGGNGLYKSVDGGRSWNLLTATADNQPQVFSTFDITFNVAIHPTTGELYVATWVGIYRSSNGGASFEPVLSVPGDNQTDIMITPSGVLYASVSNDGVYRSTDGIAWTEVLIDRLYPTNPPLFRRTVLAYDPSDENVIYAFADNPLADAFLWRYKHHPTTPTVADLTENLPRLGGPVGDINTQTGYNMVIEVHPSDPNIIFVGGTNLYRSTNGFTAETGTEWIGGYSPLNNVSIYPNHHPDQHVLVFYPSNPIRAVSANDGGVQVTENILTSNPGPHPVAWTSLNNGYLTTQPYTVAIEPKGTGEQLIAGFQDNGTWFTPSSDLTSPWTEAYGGDGAFNALADSGVTRYVSSQFGNIYRLNYTSPTATDYVSFTRITPAGTNSFDFNFVAPFILDPADDNIMYLPVNRTIWRNDNLDAIPLFSNAKTNVNWNNLTNTLVPATHYISALAISRQAPANRLYYGTNNGLIYRIDNANFGNPTPTDLATGKGLPPGNVICLTVDPANADRVFAVFSNYNIPSIFYTDNGGNSWINVSGNLEENPTGTGSGPSARWLAIEGNSDRYYVGTSTGLYATTTLNGNSTNWTREDVDGMGNVVVPMVQTRDDGFVAAATHGNGLYSGKFEVTPIPQPTLLVANPIDDFEVFANSPNTIIDLSEVFVDTDGDPITYSVMNTNPELATVTLEGQYLVIDYMPDVTGKLSIGVVATAGDETVLEPFSVTIRTLEYVLYNQNVAPYGERPSQLFTDFDSALAQSADDFVIPAGQSWSIDKVYAPGVVNGAPVFNAAQVIIYADNGGKPGTEVYNSGAVTPASGEQDSNLTLELPTPATLSAGQYWLSVFAVLPYGEGDQWFWGTTDSVRGNEAHFRDESDLFGVGATDWTPLSEAFSEPPPVDMLFILYGTGTGLPTPAAPSNLEVLYTSATAFTLTWQDNSDNEVGFLIERSTNGTAFNIRATVGPNDTTYTDTDFFNPTLTYYYRVAAIGISDTSAYSNTAYTAVIPPAPKAKPASFVFPSFFIANWEASPGAKFYELDVFTADSIYLRGYKGRVVFGTSALVIGTHPHHKYFYQLRAVNAGGESPNSNVIAVAPIRNLILKAVCSDNPQTTRRWRISNPNPVAVEVEWSLYRSSQYGKLMAPPGDSYVTTNTMRGLNTLIIVWRDDKCLPHLSVKTSTTTQCSPGYDDAIARSDQGEEAEETDSPFIIDAYPNPAREKFQIMIASPFDDHVEMEIFDLKGEKLHSGKALSNTIVEVDAAAYPSGAYILKAKHLMYDRTIKLVKQ